MCCHMQMSLRLVWTVVKLHLSCVSFIASQSVAELSLLLSMYDIVLFVDVRIGVEDVQSLATVTTACAEWTGDNASF